MPTVRGVLQDYSKHALDVDDSIPKAVRPQNSACYIVSLQGDRVAFFNIVKSDTNVSAFVCWQYRNNCKHYLSKT